ncbi:hypothetical protein NLM24_03060 [Nocardia zapadnayensis]|uniref:hypothetical protein n=1 Tax=Nocardia rhamnosiphila TaxID=426716 RepID=UPI002246E1DF|nr:hypothetical protein [Nocardia zapadnayensis]MCX0269708.1 hypothetical protein [Nocardia zapadnayensis]
MTAATEPTTLLDRYQAYRVRRWLVREKQIAGMLPGWRTTRRRRALVVLVITALAVLFVTGLLCAFGVTWAALFAGLSALVFLPAWTMLRIVSQAQDNAPAETLDEMEFAQREKARSFGLSVTQGLTVFPMMYLVWSGALFPEADAFRTAYAGGVMVLATVLAGGCAPAMILAWNRSEPEPEN